jgi:branched-chain amino acid transport system substrate-binding protein
MILTALALVVCSCQVGGTRPIVKIGLTAPFTGFDEAVGYSVIGAVRLAVRERNLAGGVAGYSVELVALDDGNEPEMAAQRAREMIIDPAVMAVVGGFDGPAVVAAAAEYERAGMPFVALSGAEALSTGSSAFRLVGRESAAGATAGDVVVRALAVRRIAVVSDDAPGQAALVEAFAGAAQAGGAGIVARIQVARWQLDFAPALQQIAAVAPDAVFFAGRAAEAGELLKQMRSAGVKAVFVGGPGVDDARVVQIAGPAAQGVWYVSLGFQLGQVGDADLRERLKQAGLRPAGAYTALAYDATQVVLDALARAIKTGGKPTRQAVAVALQSTRLQGTTGEIAFNQQGDRQLAPLATYVLADGAYPGVITK